MVDRGFQERLSRINSKEEAETLLAEAMQRLEEVAKYKGNTDRALVSVYYSRKKRCLDYFTRRGFRESSGTSEYKFTQLLVFDVHGFKFSQHEKAIKRSAEGHVDHQRKVEDEELSEQVDIWNKDKHLLLFSMTKIMETLDIHYIR